MAMIYSTIVVLHVLFVVAVCYSRTPKGKNENKRFLKTNTKKTIKTQNEKKINKMVKNNNKKSNCSLKMCIFRKT